MDELRRPEVTLVGSSRPLPTALPVAPRGRSRRWELIAATAFALLVAGVPAPAPEEPVAVLAAVLVPQPDGLSLSQSGVLVLPLELRNPGPALQVTEARVYAEPVIADAVVQAPTEVDASGLRRFVALVAPDCRLLRPGSPLEFRATVRLTVRAQRTIGDLVVDVGAVPAVRRTISGLCG